MSKAETKPFLTLLPVKMHDKLRKVAFRQDRKMAEIVREAIAQYLNK